MKMPIKDSPKINLDDVTFEYIRKDDIMTRKAVEDIINKHSMYTGSMGVDVYINGKHYNAPEVTFTQNYGETPKVYIHGDLSISPIPKIKDVIFNPPATIVFWSDNTKTVVKADEETYDPENGIAMAISRKMIGDNKREYYNIFRHYLKKWEKHKKTKKEPRDNVSYDFFVPIDNDVDDIISKMNEIIETYASLRVSDVYDLLGLDCTYIDNMYGWTSIKNIEIVDTRNGHLIKMPRALPI